MEKQESKNVLLEIDKEFSDYSAKNGAQAAFAKYASDSVVTYRDKQTPLVGRDKLVESFSKFPESASLTWIPFLAENSG